MSGKEKVPPEQPIPINLDFGTFHFSMTLGRQTVLTDDTRYMLDQHGINGFIASDEFLQELAEYSPEDVEKEFKAIASSPQQKAAYQIIGCVLSPEGLVRFNRPFLSLEDSITRNMFRSIADNLLEGDLLYFHPADLARKASTNQVRYKDGIQRYWDRDEIYSQLLLAFSERGKQFGEIGESRDKHDPSIYWPGHIGRILDLAKKLCEGKIPADNIDHIKEIIYQDISLIMKFSGLKVEDALKIVNEVERISGEGFSLIS